MPRYALRPYKGASDLHSLISFAQRCTAARLPGPTYYHPGDFVWQLHAEGASADVQLWLRNAHVVACALFEPPLHFQFDIDSTLEDQASLAEEIIGWAEQRCAQAAERDEIPIAYQMLGAGTLSTTALDTEAQRIDWLTRRGYARAERHSIRMARSVDESLPEVSLPFGAHVRHALESDVAERAELHRDAWSVWGPSCYGVEAYQRLRAAPLYDPELDVVVEYGGRLVSYCVCWCDAVNGTGYFEPVGTRPSAVGRGFGRAAIFEGLRRMRDRGMHTATVQTASVNEPAQALYGAAGFRVVEREHFYVKRM